MMFIKKSPMQKLETVLATLRERSGRLASKQDTARDTLAAAMSARELWMIEGDLDDAKRAANLQSAVEAAQNVLAGINGAMVTLAKQIDDAAVELASEKAGIARQAAADVLAQELAAVEKQLQPWLTATRELAAGFDRLGNARLEARSISNYLSNAAGEIEIAATLTMQDLNRVVKAIADGAEPIPSKPAVPTPAATLPAPAATKRVFATKNLKWTNGGDGVHVAPAWFDVDLPPAAADRALNLGAAVPMEHPTRKKMHGQRPISHPSPANCLPLTDDAEVADGQDSGVHELPSHRSAFTPLDRGATVTGTLGLGDALDRGGNL
jgi:hypothetical protein